MHSWFTVRGQTERLRGVLQFKPTEVNMGSQGSGECFALEPWTLGFALTILMCAEDSTTGIDQPVLICPYREGEVHA